MACRLNSEIYSTALGMGRDDVLLIWPEDIIINPAHLTRKYDPDLVDIEMMAASFTDVDQQQAITGMRNVDGNVELVAGRHRLEGMLLYNKHNPEDRRRVRTAVKAKYDVKKAFESGIAENLHRTSLSIVDNARNVVGGQAAHGYSDLEIRTLYGTEFEEVDGRMQKIPQPQIWLENLRRIYGLSEELQRRIHNKEISANVGIFLASKVKPENRDNVLATAKNDFGKITDTTVKNAARKLAVVGAVKLNPTEQVKTWKKLAKHSDRFVRDLAATVIEWQNNTLTEAEFINELRNLRPEQECKALVLVAA